MIGEKSNLLSTNRALREGDESEASGVNSNQTLKENSIFLSVSVSDTGCGMNDDLKRKCFVLFGNLRFKKDINQGGMGLGLAASSLICKALGGELNIIRSEENEGSKFQFTMKVEFGKPIEELGTVQGERSKTNSQLSNQFTENEYK